MLGTSSARGNWGLVLALVAAGCASDNESGASDDGGSASTGSSGSTAADATGPTVTSESTAGTGAAGATTAPATGVGSESGATETQPEPTVPEGAVVLFASPDVFSGDIQGDAEGSLAAFVDGACAASPSYAAFACSEARALISIPGEGFVERIPVGQPFYAPNATLIAADDNALVSGILDSTLVGAGVLPAEAPRFWSGGPSTAGDCGDWTRSDVDGATGDGSLAGAGWMAVFLMPCTSELPLLCACWR